MNEPIRDPRMGTTFGHYRILGLLDRAGVGQTHRAVDTNSDQMVALTLLPPTARRERLDHELRIVAGLTEPHIRPLHEWGRISGICYVATKFVSGETLQSRVATFGPIEPARAVAIVEQIASALDAAHAARLTHRDVRPCNVLVADDGAAYLLCLGVSDAVPRASDPNSYAYMAPEHFREQRLTNRADVYSLAGVLADMLTGERPFPGARTARQVIQAQLTGAPPRPSQSRPHAIPAAFDAVIARAMAKNPGHRYPTAGDLARAARDALPDLGAAPTGVAQRPRPAGPAEPVVLPTWVAPRPAWRRPKVLAAAAAVLLVLVGAVLGGRALTGGHAAGSSVSSTAQSGDYQREVLPFSGLTGPEGVAVDSAGGVYVSNIDNDRVMKLTPGAPDQSVLAFSTLKEPYGLAVDGSGNVYVGDTDNDRVLELAVGASAQRVLPFTGLKRPMGLAVDVSGTVYVVDSGNDRVVKLAAGSTEQKVLGFQGLERPKGIAIDSGGNLYIADTGNNRVVKLAEGSGEQTVLPFTGLKDPSGLATDTAGSLYLTDGPRVLKLSAGASVQTVLPDHGLGNAHGVVVDAAGNVYVTDYGNDQVVKLAAG